MRLVFIGGGLAIAIAAGALFLFERKIRLRHRRVLADVRGDREAQPIVEPMRMRVLGARFADGMPLRAPWAKQSVETIFATGQALFIGASLVIPLECVDDAAVVRQALRLRFWRGGELLEISLQARLHDLERLRREIHLRQKNVAEKLISLVQQ